MPDEVVSKSDRLKMLQAAVAIAKKRGAMQGKVLEELKCIAFKGEHSDGTKAGRSARTYALKLLHSEVPEEILKQSVGVANKELTEVKIMVVLDSPVIDPRVTTVMVQNMFIGNDLPRPTACLEGKGVLDGTSLNSLPEPDDEEDFE